MVQGVEGIDVSLPVMPFQSVREVQLVPSQCVDVEGIDASKRSGCCGSDTCCT